MYYYQVKKITLKNIVEDMSIPRDRVHELSRKNKIEFRIRKIIKKCIHPEQIKLVLEENLSLLKRSLRSTNLKKQNILQLKLFSGCGGMALGFRNAGISSDLL